MAQSKFGKVNARDVLHGFILAFVSATLTGLYESLVTGSIPSLASIKLHVLAGVTAGIGYLLKQFFQNDAGVLLKKSNENPVKPPREGEPGNP